MERMQEICNAENAPYPEIRFTDTHFYIVFKPSHEYMKMAGDEEITKEIGIDLNERQRKFIESLKEKGKLSRADYEIITKTSKRTAIRDLKYLVNNGVIIDISTSRTDPNRRYKLR